MTSNAGSTDSASLGFNKTANDINAEVTMKALERFLRPEFLGRVDEIVIFNQLTHDDFEKIAKLMLGELTMKAFRFILQKKHSAQRKMQEDFVIA